MSRRIGTISGISLLVAVLCVSGCTTSQKKPLEKLGVVSAVGYDVAQNQRLLGTMVLPNFTETGKEKVDVLTSTAHTSKELRFNMSRLSERQLVSGQIRVVLYGEDLAKEGILPLSDTLFRDAEIGSQMHLAVVQGRAVDMLEHRFPDKPSVDIYLYQMLRKEMQQNSIPKSNLHLFLRDVYDKGSDPVLPYLRLGKEDVIVDGVALFQDDLFVGHLTADKARLLSYMKGGGEGGEIDVVLPGTAPHGDQVHAVIMYLKMKRKETVTGSAQAPHFSIRMDIRGALNEYTGYLDMEKKEQVQKVEQSLEVTLKKQMQNLLTELQKTYKVDPLGFGELYRSKGYVEELDHKTWAAIYDKATFDVAVKVKVLQTGMIH